MNAAKVHRINNFLFRRNIPFIPKLLTIFIQLVYGCRIPPDCVFGKGTSLAYGGMGVLLVAQTQFGERCSIGTGVKVVRKFPYRNVPQFGNDVYIGPNAIICGPVRIGSNVVIAPGAVVLNSVPSDAVVAGIPARIIARTSELGYSIGDNPKYLDGTSPYLQFESSRRSQPSDAIPLGLAGTESGLGPSND